VLRSISPRERALGSAAILKCLNRLHHFLESEVVLVYAPLPSEPDLMALLPKYLGEKIFCFPRVTPLGLQLHSVSREKELVKLGSMREPNPISSLPISPDRVDFAIIPGMAFDPQNGVRLGRGGGFYDRLLSSPRFTAFTLGVCFHEQLMPHLPMEAHDCAVRGVLTNRGLV
jgi:5-formyltetrahydrofolate cyclo-ligase